MLEVEERVGDKVVRRALLQSVHNADMFLAKAVMRPASEVAFNEVKALMDRFMPVAV